MATTTPKMRALAVVVVLALAGVAWWVIGAARYDDLTLGSTTSAGSDGRHVRSEFDDEEVVRKTLRGGKIDDYGVSVRNDGGRAVEITGIGRAPQPEDAIQDSFAESLMPLAVRMNPADGPGHSDRMVPFRPFTLEPGHERFFMITWRMPPCSYWDEGSAFTIGSFDVRYRSLVLEKELSIELREGIEVARGRTCSSA